MKKKSVKYIKFFIGVMLICSLVAPSYAALSASDGSAFVTKAEFDSALADFNARLTTFEAGINSKIDSQVTSYLDRNGIWSGKSQTLLNPAYGTTGVVCYKNGRKAFFYDTYDGSSYEGGSSLSFKCTVNDRQEYIFLNDRVCYANKSGLMYFVYALESKSVFPKDKRIYINNNGGTGSYFDAIQIGKGDGSQTFHMRKAASGDTSDYTIDTYNELMSVTQLNNTTGTTFYAAYPNFLTATALFFVAQGETIWLRWYGIWVNGGAGQGTADLSYFGPCLTEAQRPVIKITACMVY